MGIRKKKTFLSGLLSSFSVNPGINDVGAFETVESDLGYQLPADYKGFMLRTDGGETLPPLNRFCFYRLAELLPRRTDGQPPDVLEFGTDDEDGYGFDLKREHDIANYPIVKYPLGDRDRDDLEDVNVNFAEFVIAIGQCPGDVS